MFEPIDYSKEYKIYCNSLKMLAARDYVVPTKEVDLPSEEQYRARLEQDPRRIEIFKHMIEDKSIALHTNISRSLMNEKQLEDLIKMYYGKCSAMIIIFKFQNQRFWDLHKLQTRISQLLHFAKRVNLKLQLFEQESLMFSLLEHELVPKHDLLSCQAKAKLLEKYKINDSQLPKILLSDPVARYLGLLSGDVVRITRKSQGSGTCVTYRIASEY